MIQGLDFIMYCGGVGILLVAGAWSFKILNDVRIKLKATKIVNQRRIDEPQELDHMAKRLHELRDAQFGASMTPRPRQTAPPTWKSKTTNKQ